MKKTPERTLIGALLAFALAALPAHAAENRQFTEIDGYVIHYNAVSTADVPPAVAKAYDIVRSRARGLLNISVLRKTEGAIGTPEPVRARVSVEAKNLTGQLKPFKVREITEDGAIYYLGDFSVNDGETVVFDIRVTPEGSDRTHEIRFKRQFFISD